MYVYKGDRRNNLIIVPTIKQIDKQEYEANWYPTGLMARQRLPAVWLYLQYFSIENQQFSDIQLAFIIDTSWEP